MSSSSEIKNNTTKYDVVILPETKSKDDVVILPQNKSRCSNPFSGCGGKIKAWGEGHPRMKKALIGTGIALAVVTVLGGALLAYMHFSGLGISKAGFATLGGKISALATKAWTHFKGAMNSTHTMSTAQLIYKVALPTIGGTALVALLAVKGKAMKQKCAEKIYQKLEHLRDQHARRAERPE